MKVLRFHVQVQQAHGEEKEERMENGNIWSWKSSSLRLKNMEEEEDKIPPPQTPQEPMEFLSRSWSVSASEISKALAEKKKIYQVPNNFLPHATIIPSQYSIIEPELAVKVNGLPSMLNNTSRKLQN
ncbi:hypothetical protein MRB53_019214 [Persea americana]|uniref:Uncharacterized protein n=1 Tax=Persea americana TaxID=3435 RepID=A0ACC2KYL0_PERAE|nr:hypothetical protein MRB53_019214 [Persea americana]